MNICRMKREGRMCPSVRWSFLGKEYVNKEKDLENCGEKSSHSSLWLIRALLETTVEKIE